MRAIAVAVFVFAVGGELGAGALLLVLKLYMAPFVVPEEFWAVRRKKYLVFVRNPVM